MTGTLFCFGLGYSALRLARALGRQGWDVAGTCRSAEKQADLEAEGITAFLMNETERPDPTAFATASHVLVSIPPDADGDPVARAFGDDLAARADIEWAGYLSTTGVYGDKGGAWVDETTPRRPQYGAGRPASRRRTGVAGAL